MCTNLEKKSAKHASSFNEVVFLTEKKNHIVVITLVSLCMNTSQESMLQEEIMVNPKITVARSNYKYCSNQTMHEIKPY